MTTPTLAQIQADAAAATTALGSVATAVTAAQAANVTLSADLASYVAAQQPAAPPASTGPSPAGAVLPPAVAIIDSAKQPWTIDSTGDVLVNGKIAGSSAPIKDAVYLWTDAKSIYAWSKSQGGMVWLGGGYWGNDYAGVMLAGLRALGITPPSPTPPSSPPPAATSSASTTTSTTSSSSSSTTPTPPVVTGPTSSVPADLPTTGRAVVLTFASGSAPNGQTGTQFTFYENNAKDMGDYADPFGFGVSQHCHRVLNAGLQIAVDFRPDTDGSREEIVVRYGMLPASFYAAASATSPAVADITAPYTADFYNNGALVVSLTIPLHWYWAKWRWSKTSAGAINVPRPVKTTAAALISQGLILPYNSAYTYGSATPAPAEFIWPMGAVDAGNSQTNTGLFIDVGAEGGRPDIGPMTEWQADWILNGTASSLATLFAHGEVVAAMPINWIDDQTGAIINCFTYQTQIISPTVLRYVPQSPENEAQGKFVYEPAHDPAIAYLPFLLTGDAYYLEGIHAQANYTIGWTQQFTAGEYNPIPGFVTSNQYRAVAWGLRDIFYARKVTPASTPSWLNNQAYWERVTNANLGNAATGPQAVMASTAIVESLFRCYPWSNQYVAWQATFIVTVMSIAQRFGYTEWLPFYKWFVQGLCNFSNGTSGWPRNFPVPYFFQPVKGVPGGETLGPPVPNGSGTFVNSQGVTVTYDDATYTGYASGAADYFSSGGIANGAEVSGSFNGQPTVITSQGANFNGDPTVTDPYATWSTTNAGTIQELVDNLGNEHECFVRGAMHLAMLDNVVLDATVCSEFLQAAFPAFAAKWGPVAMNRFAF